MTTIQLEYPWCTAEILGQRAHVRAVVDTVLDTRCLSGEKMIVGWVRGHLHATGNEGCPPHGLLFGYGWDCANAGTHEADERDVGVGRIDDVSDLGI